MAKSSRRQSKFAERVSSYKALTLLEAFFSTPLYFLLYMIIYFQNCFRLFGSPCGGALWSPFFVLTLAVFFIVNISACVECTYKDRKTITIRRSYVILLMVMLWIKLIVCAVIITISIVPLYPSLMLLPLFVMEILLIKKTHDVLNPYVIKVPSISSSKIRKKSDYTDDTI